MNQLHLIVEGEGDAAALPVLVRKILSANALDHVQLTKPQISGDVRKAGKRFGDFLRYALKNACPILWVLDCDDKSEEGVSGCPVQHVKKFQTAFQSLQLHQPQPLEFAFFVKEFESLFLAEQRALKSFYHLPDTLEIDIETTRRRNAKGEISKLLSKDRGYKESTDQAKIAARLDLAVCREVSRDYRHFEDAILRLCKPITTL